MTDATARARASLVAAALPVAAAIAVFGAIYGAAARPVLGPELTVVGSALIFSGAAQFTMIALLAAGTGPAGVLAAVTTLALRHLPLGMLMRPKLSVTGVRLAAVSVFLIDETTGLALTRGEPAERTLTTAGAMAYAAWVAGTLVGVLGGSATSVEPLADALFPVLFVGLAALTAARRTDVVRALAAGASVIALLSVWPTAGALGAIGVAAVVAAVGDPT